MLGATPARPTNIARRTLLRTILDCAPSYGLARSTTMPITCFNYPISLPIGMSVLANTDWRRRKKTQRVGKHSRAPGPHAAVPLKALQPGRSWCSRRDLPPLPPAARRSSECSPPCVCLAISTGLLFSGNPRPETGLLFYFPSLASSRVAWFRLFSLSFFAAFLSFCTGFFFSSSYGPLEVVRQLLLFLSFSRPSSFSLSNLREIQKHFGWPAEIVPPTQILLFASFD